MKIQKDLGSAFILNVPHLVGWRKLCQLIDQTLNVKVCVHMCVCVCVCTCADSVSVLILKAAPLSESRSVKWEYTHLQTQQKKNPKNNPKTVLVHHKIKLVAYKRQLQHHPMFQNAQNPLLPTQMHSLPPYQKD